MSLFSSIQLANNALRANQIGLQVVGQNIANANTPGYIREEVLLSPAPTQEVGRLLLGLGVDVVGITQKIDRFLEERLRGAVSDRAHSEAQEKVWFQLEALIGELSDTDLSTSLTNFFASIQEVLNQPESVSVRNLAVLQGQTLTTDINQLARRVTDLRRDLNARVEGSVVDINRLIEEIRTLNVRIVETEGGNTSASDAVGLRDQRSLALSNLSELISIRAIEQPSGAVNVFTGGDFLVFEGTAREVEVSLSSDGGITVANLQIAETDTPLDLSQGEIGGFVAARDTILAGFGENLDTLASTLAFEFNRLYSSGQGLKGHQQLTSEFAVDDSSQPLDVAGLTFTPENGSFQVLIFNRQTGLTETTDVTVNLDGLDDDTTLDDLVAALDAIDGLSASVTSDGRLELNSDAPEQDFAFNNDTSGVLAALGLNTFFSGTTASGLSINQVVAGDPATFAASRVGIGPDTTNAIELANFLDRPLDSADGSTLSVLYDRLTGETTQNAAVARAVAEGFRVFEQTLQGDHLAISGVSIDEEAVRMIAFQRSFQAAARYIATLSELLEILVSL